MTEDRQKGLKAAEPLLKQGKIQAAIGKLRGVSRNAPGDLLTMNRLGDLLVRQGQNAEAVECYAKIACQYAEQGFFPKATAIHKKILRIDPRNLSSMVELGALYAQQNLHGEARNYLLHAGNQYTEDQEFDKARAVYERLVAAEPEEMLHKVRLAETRAAEGDTEIAGAELLAVGQVQLDKGKHADAEKLYKRVRALLPSCHEALLGLVKCLSETGREDQALTLMEEAAEGAASTPTIVGELAWKYESCGRRDEALAVLRKTQLLEISRRTWINFFRSYLERGEVDRLWQEFGPAFQTQGDQGDPELLVDFFEELGELEEHGHIPAIQRLQALHEKRGDVDGTVRSLEWLVRSYQAQSMEDEASRALEQLRKIAPESPLLGGGSVSEAPVEPSEPPIEFGTDVGTDSATPVAPVVADLPPDVEAPAVPLNRADEEFVAGRLTQAEVLDKYGLKRQALEQLQEIAARFPGHVRAQEQRVQLQRSSGDNRALGESLVQLAVALRASGDIQGAVQAAEEAGSRASLAPETSALLERLRLIPSAGAPVTGDAGVSVAASASAGSGAASATIATAEPPARPTQVSTDLGGTGRAPSTDMLKEVEEYITAGALEDARRRVSALGSLGYASPELADLERRIEEQLGASAGGLETLADPEPLGPDDDLSALTAALENELSIDNAPIAPEEDAEQSIDEVFSAFKEQVQETVAADDYRTQYDLGIAYKEMGLVDEAIEQFRVAANSSELHRDSCSMIGMCCRERGDLAEAEKSYRQAIDVPGTPDEDLSGIHYDLAEVLLEVGDAAGALGEFRHVLQTDPAYRDVRRRVTDLESQLQS